LFLLLSVFISYYDRLYSFLFFCLFITSIIFHSTYNRYIQVLDSCMVLLIIIYGLYILVHKIYRVNTYEKYIMFTTIISTFITTLILFFYGYLYKCFCYDKNPIIQNLYHSLLHIISVFGHFSIVIL
jgi:hypothetical protein